MSAFQGITLCHRVSETSVQGKDMTIYSGISKATSKAAAPKITKTTPGTKTVPALTAAKTAKIAAATGKTAAAAARDAGSAAAAAIRAGASPEEAGLVAAAAAKTTPTSKIAPTAKADPIAKTSPTAKMALATRATMNAKTDVSVAVPVASKAKNTRKNGICRPTLLRKNGMSTLRDPMKRCLCGENLSSKGQRSHHMPIPMGGLNHPNSQSEPAQSLNHNRNHRSRADNEVDNQGVCLVPSLWLCS